MLGHQKALWAETPAKPGPTNGAMPTVERPPSVVGQPLPFNGGKLGQFIYMPYTFLGYGGTLALIFVVMAAWWIIVDWNEETNKFLIEM